MTIGLNFLKALAVFLFIGYGSALGQSQATGRVDPAVAKLGKGFISSAAKVNGTSLHYVRGGTGPAIILLHGFPEDWSEFHKIMPRLAKKFTVIAVDLRGIGGSTATPGGYDAANLAEDIHQLAQQLKLGRVYIAGHDMGGMVAYAFVRRYPQATRGVMILDVPLPGIEPWEEVKANPLLWHLNFHQTPDLPEKLVSGRQADYFKHFYTIGTLNKTAISESDAAHYVNSYASPAQLRAGFELYRALPSAEKFNAAQRDTIEVPIVLAGGDNSFGKLMSKVGEALRAHGCANVTIETIKDSGHYVADEQPESVAELIERYAAV